MAEDLNIWKELKKNGEVSVCDCGRRFWIYWKSREKEHQADEIMTKCAVCYFGDGNKK